MIITTDGREFVVGVFDADGYECKDLVGVFASEEAAVKVSDDLRAKDSLEFDERRRQHKTRSINSRVFSVEFLEIGTQL